MVTDVSLEATLLARLHGLAVAPVDPAAGLDADMDVDVDTAAEAALLAASMLGEVGGQ